MSVPYPSTLPEPLLDMITQPSRTFVRTDFDHGTRYRKSYCGVYLLQARWVFTPDQMKQFRSWFYNDLLNGVKSFMADWRIEGSDVNNKEFHFYEPYRVATSYRRGQNYEVTATLELKTNINELDGFIP